MKQITESDRWYTLVPGTLVTMDESKVQGTSVLMPQCRNNRGWCAECGPVLFCPVL